jgi:hypothetical protein
MENKIKSETKEIFIGMFRPRWEDVVQWPNTHKGEVMGHIQCSCGHVLQSVEGTREHWQMGHFDTPVYK